MKKNPQKTKGVCHDQKTTREKRPPKARFQNSLFPPEKYRRQKDGRFAQKSHFQKIQILSPEAAPQKT
ncbi:MAG: hypothetical protein LUG62_04750, partial [Clostridiales bacterium]|nr:hypothetical protein [Clostridiales bacterium]